MFESRESQGQVESGAARQAVGVTRVRGFNRRTALGLGLGLALWVAGPEAWASKVVWKRTTLEERDGVWRVQVEVHLDRAPDVAHIPVRFSFKQTMHFERALVDGSGDKPVLRKVPLEHQTPTIESVDIGFLDPGTGKTEKRTRFSFEVTRERGFEAGQYEVEISDARSNSQIGEKVMVTLEGDNPVVDRRAMVFTEKKKAEGGDSSAPNPKLAEKRQLSPDDPEYWAGGPTKPEEEEKALPPPASMQEKPGGCGCRVGGRAPERMGALGVAGLLVAFLARRRAQVSLEHGFHS